MKNKIFKHLLLLGTELLLFIVINILLASLMFIFKVGITSHYVMISLFFCIIVTVYLSIKEKILTKKNYYLGILYIVFPLVIIHSSIYLNGKVVDTSYDGNAYQKAIVGLLKDGWNPIYESSEDFDESNEHKIYLKESGHYLWVDHYAKASHIYQANIYALTGNIESGKSINTLSIISLSLILFSLMALHFKKVLFPLFFTICAITPSFVCAQFLTNYIDLLVYIYLLLLILSLFYLDYNEQKRIGFVIYLSCLLMLINIKFNSFAYAGLYCLGYYIYFIVKLKKGILNKKFFWKFTGISAIGVILGVFVIGLSVYPKNLIEKGNPFYPIYGKGKVDIISMYQPASFKNMSTPKKYFISMFSKVDNIGWWSNYEPILKIPFSYDDKEIDVIKSSDTRISGNGVIFGGIFIISSCLTLVLSFIMLKKDKKMFVLCTYIIWNALPFKIMILLGALQSVNKQYYDAARVDGTSRFRVFTKITVPLISPMLLYVVVTGFIGAFKEYTSAVGIFGENLKDYGMTTMVGFIYDSLSQVWTGRAAAGALFLFVIILFITLIQFLVSKKKVHY